MSVESSVVLKRLTYFPKRKISKILLVYYLLFHVVGFDFGFASALKRKYRFYIQKTTKFISILLFVVMLVYLACLYNDVWCWVSVFKYNGFILVLLITRYKLYHLINDINGICYLTSKQLQIINITAILYTVVIHLIKITLLTLRCIGENDAYCRKFYSIYVFIIYIGIAFSLDITVVTQIIITYYFKCSVHLIQVLLKKSKRKLDLFEKSYLAIVNCYDKIRPFFDWMVSFYLNLLHLKNSATLCLGPILVYF